MTKVIDPKTGQTVTGKHCTKCGEWKTLDEFYKSKNGRLGRVSRCLICSREDKREIAKRDSKKIVERVRNWRLIPENRERKNKLERERRKNPAVAKANADYNREWRSAPENNDRLNARRRKQRQTDPDFREKDLAYKREYYSRPDVIEASRAKAKEYNSDPAVKERFNARRRERYASDPDFLCSVKCRDFVRRAARKTGSAKNTTTHDALRYSPLDLRLRMEAQFRSGMSWDNYGDWHIDHKKPIAAFIAQGIVDPRTINMLCNLQPMWAEENQQKSSVWPPRASNDNGSVIHNVSDRPRTVLQKPRMACVSGAGKGGSSS